MGSKRRAWNYNKVTIICAICKKKLLLSPADAKVRKHCSITCKVKASKGIKHPLFRGVNHPNWKGGLPDCMDCGKKLSNYMYKRCKHCSNLGDRSPSWKGGVTPEHRRIRSSHKYKVWRDAVFQRDNYTCVMCGVRNQSGLGKTIYLNADHIKRFAEYPKLRFKVNNGRTLCVPCHRATGTFGRIPYAI